MAGVSSEGGAGSSKLDTNLNLVPFIDLLSTLILFLLLSVVWVQVSSIPASVDTKGKSAEAISMESTKISLHVTPGGVRVSFPGAGVQTLSADRLRAFLAAKASHLQQQMPCVVSADDTVEYGSVVDTVDAARNAGLNMVALGSD